MAPDPAGLSLIPMAAWLRAEVPAFGASGECRVELTAQAARSSQLLIEELVRLHALDARAIGLGSFGRPHGYLARQVRR